MKGRWFTADSQERILKADLGAHMAAYEHQGRHIICKDPSFELWGEELGNHT